MTTYQMKNRDGRPSTKLGCDDAGAPKAITVSYALNGTALALNDVLQSPLFSEGSTILDVMVVASDLDTGGSPAITLDVGTGDAPQYFIAASTIGQAGGVARASAVTARPLTLTKDDTIDVVVHAGPAAGATTGTVDLTVLFLPPNA